MRKYRTGFGLSFFRIFTVIVFIVLQLSFLSAFAYVIKHYVLLAYFLIEGLSIATIIMLMSDRRNESYKLLWMAIILLFPVVGHIWYEFWGKDSSHDKRHQMIQSKIEQANAQNIVDKKMLARIREENENHGKLTHFLATLGYPPYENTKLHYYKEGEKVLHDMIDDMLEAKKFIFLSTFTIAEGELWKVILPILQKKRKTGVEVKILYDDAGSVFRFSDKSLEKLQKSDIQVLRFNALEQYVLHPYFHHRTHQRILIVDGITAYTGGVNITDRNMNWTRKDGHFKDNAIRLYGEGVWSLTLLFLGMWSTKYEVKAYDDYRPGELNRWCNCCRQHENNKSTSHCVPYGDSPSNDVYHPAKDMYHMMISNARKHVFIMTPYLILPAEMENAIRLAALGGVRVVIITPGLPYNRWKKRLTTFNYGPLLEAGVEIYEYQDGVVHAKMCLNEESAIIGTMNFDYRSFYLNYECGVWLDDVWIRKEMEEDFLTTLSNCKQINYKEWKSRPKTVKLVEFILAIWKTHF